jgi:hypothetical protein
MQMMAVVGNQPPEVVTRGVLWALEEGSMFDDPRSDETRDRDDWRERDALDREHIDPRDVFTERLNLPRGLEREYVRDRGHQYEIRGSEARTLATVGAFRVVLSRDLHDHNGQPCDPRKGDLQSLREQGLIRTVQLDGRKDVVVVLTKRGRDLLDSHRDREKDRGQTFYADLKKPREIEHDAQVFRAYLREAERLQERGARIERVVLDYELKRDYQRFLQERNRGHADSDGRPDRSPEEIAEWAREHDLPYFDGHVHFPDFRIEYSTPDSRWEHDDVEVVTMHYRGGHAAAAARSGFSRVGGSSARIGGAPFDPDYAEEVLR